VSVLVCGCARACVRVICVYFSLFVHLSLSRREVLAGFGLAFLSDLVSSKAEARAELRYRSRERERKLLAKCFSDNY
jgi:hypothetical protein